MASDVEKLVWAIEEESENGTDIKQLDRSLLRMLFCPRREEVPVGKIVRYVKLAVTESLLIDEDGYRTRFIADKPLYPQVVFLSDSTVTELLDRENQIARTILDYYKDSEKEKFPPSIELGKIARFILPMEYFVKYYFVKYKPIPGMEPTTLYHEIESGVLARYYSIPVYASSDLTGDCGVLVMDGLQGMEFRYLPYRSLLLGGHWNEAFHVYVNDTKFIKLVDLKNNKE